MNSETIAVHWHDDSQPVYSVSFQPLETQARLASAGGDNNVRIWRVNHTNNSSSSPTSSDPNATSVEYLLTLRKHTQAVNVVRFSPQGHVLASGGDDGMVILWCKSDKMVAEFGHQDDDATESWVARHMLNAQLEVYDVAWLPDGLFLAAGSMDNVTRVFCAETGQKLVELADHTHYVQGVAWDPRNAFLATQSADRTVQIYLLGENVSPTPYCRISKADLPSTKLSKKVPTSDGAAATDTAIPTAFTTAGSTAPSATTTHATSASAVTEPTAPSTPSSRKKTHLFHSETLQSFFRRLAFSPDGALLLAPLGVYKDEKNDDSETVYVFTRAGLSKPPVCHLPGLNKPAVAIAFNPVLYRKNSGAEVFSLPYKMVFAVATQNSVVIYDTQHMRPLGVQANMHYLSITDLCWNPDGQSVMVSSTEGFCSVIRFDKGVFGDRYEKEPARENVTDNEVKNEKTTKEEEVKTEDKKTIEVEEEGIKNILESDKADVHEVQKPDKKSANEEPAPIETSDAELKAQELAESSANAVSEPSLTLDSSTEPTHSTEPMKSVSSLSPLSSAAVPPLSGKRAAEDTPQLQVTPSLLSQFVAQPVLAPEHSPTDDGAKKKRRVQPTLVTDK